MNTFDLTFHLKGFCLMLISGVNKMIKHKGNKILIYDPYISKRDNTGALFDFLVNNEYYKKYKIVYICKDYKKLRQQKICNVTCTGKFAGLFHFMTSKYVYYRSSIIRVIPAKGQHVIQMWHGSPNKGGDVGQCREDGWVNPFYTGFFSASSNFDSIYSKVFSIPVELMIRCGHPRTDILFSSPEAYSFGDYKKIILWAPTFRKARGGLHGYGKQLSNDDKLIPVISVKHIKIVDDYLKKLCLKVVVKLHPSQSLEKYADINFDNFVLLSHDEFEKRGMDLYRFMKQCDAMITDYSSIYWDYLVLDRPIGFTEDDIDDYSKGRGFVFDEPEKYKPGPKIRTVDDFLQFVTDVANGHDLYKTQRKEMNEFGNPITDGNSCKRALESIGIKL